MSFERLITPFNHGHKRTKKDVVKALIDNTHVDRVFQFANLLVTHEAKDNYNVIRALARHLSKKGALHKVRLLSRRSAQLFSSVGATNDIYKRLFVSPLYTDPHAKRDKSAFTRIAYGCTELVVTLRVLWQLQHPARHCFQLEHSHEHASSAHQRLAIYLRALSQPDDAHHIHRQLHHRQSVEQDELSANCGTDCLRAGRPDENHHTEDGAGRYDLHWPVPLGWPSIWQYQRARRRCLVADHES
jgi:hypothetical protein